MQLCQQRADLQTLAENPCISKLSGSPAPWQCSADASKEMHTTMVKTEAAQGAETLSNPPLLPVTASAPRPALLQHHHQNSPLLLPWLAGLWPYLPRAPVALSSPPTIIWSSELDHQGHSQIHLLVPSHLCSLSSHGLMELYHVPKGIFHLYLFWTLAPLDLVSFTQSFHLMLPLITTGRSVLLLVPIELYTYICSSTLLIYHDCFIIPSPSLDYMFLVIYFLLLKTHRYRVSKYLATVSA